MINITHTAQTVSNISSAIATGNLTIIIQVLSAYIPVLVIFCTQIYSILAKVSQHKEVLTAIQNNAAIMPNPIIDMVKKEGTN